MNDGRGKKGSKVDGNRREGPEPFIGSYKLVCVYGQEGCGKRTDEMPLRLKSVRVCASVVRVARSASPLYAARARTTPPTSIPRPALTDEAAPVGLSELEADGDAAAAWTPEEAEPAAFEVAAAAAEEAEESGVRAAEAEEEEPAAAGAEADASPPAGAAAGVEASPPAGAAELEQLVSEPGWMVTWSE